jgi:hypothetical protein
MDRSRSPSRRFRPALEALEDRLVPTVTYHGGAVLPNVGVDAVFLGSQWSSDPQLGQQTGQLGNFLGFLAGGTFMDMLTQAGYRVGRGSYVGGQVVPAAPGWAIGDDQIQQTLAASIVNGTLPAPDANRLYVVFVEPGVDVTTSFGDSATNVLGYHGAFWGPTGAAVTYAVIPYPTAPNAPYPGLSPFETLTKVASHELAEAVTDPQGEQIGRNAWYDETWRDPQTGARGGEIGDIVSHVILDLNGYAIQGVAGRHDQQLVPLGATYDPRFPAPPPPRHGAHAQSHQTGERRDQTGGPAHHGHRKHHVTRRADGADRLAVTTPPAPSPS